ncbi:MAG: hypothetical protein MUF49_23450 [Oculatellaceae cyanobacterium Prado106]|nr:hypothetical protein [Oculatellaceae cyanobacterium Prado106]
MTISGNEPPETPDSCNRNPPQDPAMNQPSSVKNAKPCQKPLRTNPFQSYRDATGRWVIVKSA